MKKLTNQIAAIILTTIVLCSASVAANAQSTYKLVVAKDAPVKVLGSSNIHDWTETATGVESQGDFKFDADKLIGLSSFTLVVNVKTLKSEHEAMDSRTYKAINADKFPKVTFKLVSAAVTATQKGKYLIKATGDLTIAGVTQNVVLNVTAVVNADNTITCTGSEKIKLTDYKIDPPSFMLGAMKVANDLTIQYNLNYKK